MMAFERAPIFKFDTLESTGVEQVPVGSLVITESTAEVFTKNTDQVGNNVSVQSAIDSGSLTTTITNSNVFNFLYYADEHTDTDLNGVSNRSRVVAIDPVTMTVAKTIELPRFGKAGSCDRAGLTDKMFVRTATTNDENGSATTDRFLTMVDMVDAKMTKKIPLNYKPRSSGSWNQYRNLHVISTKEKPWAHVIDVVTGRVVISVGNDNPSHPNPIGNDSRSNSTGHSCWLDADHFALLDKHEPNIQIYRVNEDHPPYTTTLMQTISTPSGSHSLKSFDRDFLLADRTFVLALEGSNTTAGDPTDSYPQVWKMTFDSSSGQLTNTTDGASNNGKIIFSDTSYTDAIHHVGVATLPSGQRIVAVPVYGKNRLYTIDFETWIIDASISPPTTSGYYQVGNGAGTGTKPAHADYCAAENRFVVTNHNGKTVSIVDFATKSVFEWTVPSLASWTEGSGFAQSHANHVIGSNYYFAETINSKFYEMNIANNGTSYRVVDVHGKLVQSFS